MDHDSTCGHCGRTWSSIETPTPAARCPFEYDHDYEPETPDPMVEDGIRELYRVASDDEADLLDDLAVRAGFRWVCSEDGFINIPDEPCGACGCLES